MAINAVKRIIKRLMLWMFAHVYRDERPKVVYYHDIGMQYTKMGTPEDLFWGHMDLLRAEDVVCFDDGFRGLWDNRDGVIARGIKPIVFIAVELIGKPGYLDWTEIHELQGCGFRFESHSWSHQDLTQFDEKALWHELYDSRQELSRLLGYEVSAICFPKGYFNDNVVTMSRKAGYRKMYVSYPGAIDLASDLVPRNLVQGSSCAEFADILRGALLPLRKHYENLHYIRR